MPTFTLSETRPPKILVLGLLASLAALVFFSYQHEKNEEEIKEDFEARIDILEEEVAVLSEEAPAVIDLDEPPIEKDDEEE